MISKEQCLSRAAFCLAYEKLYEDLSYAVARRGEYTQGSREADRIRGNLLAEAQKYSKLANGPAWRRWITPAVF